MRGKVERHGEPLLSRGQVAAIERVGLLSGREAGVLANGPGTHHVHRGIGTPQVGRYSRRVAEVLHALKVLFGVDRLHRDLLRRLPIGLDLVFLHPLVHIGRAETFGLNINTFKVWLHV